jgi:hypothetical protein
MTLDVGPLLDSIAPLSILLASAFGIARVIYKQEDHGKKLDRLALDVAELKEKHHELETQFLGHAPRRPRR